MTWRILRFSSRKRAASASASLIVTGEKGRCAECVPSSKPTRWLRGGGSCLLPRRFHQLFQLLTLPTPPSGGVYRSSHTVAELSRHSFVPAGPTEVGDGRCRMAFGSSATTDKLRHASMDNSLYNHLCITRRHDVLHDEAHIARQLSTVRSPRSARGRRRADAEEQPVDGRFDEGPEQHACPRRRERGAREQRSGY